MNQAIPQIPKAINEVVRSYAPGSPERKSLRSALGHYKDDKADIPVIIGGKRIYTGDVETIVCPHDHGHSLGQFHNAGTKEVQEAVAASEASRKEWSSMPWNDRAAIFLKAAELLVGPYRNRLNATTMLGQSKNPYQAEIDAACELIDFFRFNAEFMQRIYSDQPESSPGIWNRSEYRPLDGFVLAVCPFNFTSISGNLAAAPAMMGNTIVWKPSSTSVLSTYAIYELLEEAGLPAGVINFVPGHGPDIGGPSFASEHFAGLHFTGSTKTFRFMWKTIGDNIANYRNYPRIVGETGGKDFIVAHPSADAKAVATAIVRGSFEYQGQKCSASSRVFVPTSLWPEIKETALQQISEIKMGDVEDFGNFVNAVIDKKSFDNISAYIDEAKADPDIEILAGGGHDDSKGYFIEPTLMLTTNPGVRVMCEEIFGPVVSVFVYDDNKYDETLEIVDKSTPYALTGAVFAQDRSAVLHTMDVLEHAAGNFYINDKPTGAVVGQQPFGGGRASGTNDKAGSILNLVRWTSPRSIKENLNPPHDFRYPFLSSEE